MPRHIDELGHVNNVVYLQWVQDTAGAHWFHASSEKEQQLYRWVVLRHEIDYIKPSFENDELTGQTWVEKMEGVKSIRRVDILRDGQVLVSARTVWVMLSAETGKLTRIPSALASRFL